MTSLKFYDLLCACVDWKTPIWM